MHRRTSYFSGRVQGVGFRYTTHNIAQQHNVQGYVRNTPDGRVELVMEGPDGELDRVMESIRERMGEYIRDVKTDESPATGEFNHFNIRH